MYTNKAKLGAHIKYFHEKTVKSQQCTLVSMPVSSTSTRFGALAPACEVPQQTSPSAQEQLLQCSKCPKIFTNPGYLVAHFKEIHKKLRLFRCEECKTKFSTKGNLANHIQSVHMKKGRNEEMKN
jgi:uncharacterized Zn-finger protein